MNIPIDSSDSCVVEGDPAGRLQLHRVPEIVDASGEETEFGTALRRDAEAPGIPPDLRRSSEICSDRHEPILHVIVFVTESAPHTRAGRMAPNVIGEVYERAGGSC